MWLSDLNKALEALNADPKYRDYYVFAAVVPSGAEVLFITTNHTKLYVARDGTIREEKMGV